MRALGNGRMLVYARGADLVEVLGPDLSAPRLLTTRWRLAGQEPHQTSRRIPGTNIWTTTLRAASGTATVTDLVDTSTPTYRARVQCSDSLQLHLDLEHADRISTETRGGTSTLFARLPRSAPAYVYPSGVETYVRISVTGDAGWQHDGGSGLSLTLEPGRHLLGIDAANTYGEVSSILDDSARQFEEAYDRAVKAGADLSNRIRRVGALPTMLATLCPDLGPAAGIDMEEDCAFLVSAQLGSDGGGAAGAPFPLAYARDNYGVSRGLIDLGLDEEALRMARYRRDKWRHFGSLANAESIGHHRLRHEHENDGVEVPAYALLQYLDAVELDDSLEAEGADFLDWCWRRQTAELHEGLLPFNGDETYVAGGFLPRQYLDDRSFEASYLFYCSGRRLIDRPATERRWGAEGVQRARELLESVAVQLPRFRRAAGDWVANLPSHDAKTFASHRHGVCEACGDFATDTRRGDDGSYRCLGCRDREVHREPAGAYRVPTATLVPALLPSSPAIVPASELQSMAEQFADQVLGRTPPLINGYDLALVLLAISGSGSDRAEPWLQHVVTCAAAGGGWSERYAGTTPAGVECRPWETALNVLALRRYATTWRGPHVD